MFLLRGGSLIAAAGIFIIINDLLYFIILYFKNINLDLENTG